jgi:hypothetical protein
MPFRPLDHRKILPGRCNHQNRNGLPVIAKIFKENSAKAARKMGELVDSSDERIALMAADEIMERAWGKLRDYDRSPSNPAARGSTRATTAMRSSR